MHPGSNCALMLAVWHSSQSFQNHAIWNWSETLAFRRSSFLSGSLADDSLFMCTWNQMKKHKENQLVKSNKIFIFYHIVPVALGKWDFFLKKNLLNLKMLNQKLNHLHCGFICHQARTSKLSLFFQEVLSGTLTANPKQKGGGWMSSPCSTWGWKQATVRSTDAGPGLPSLSP